MKRHREAARIPEPWTDEIVQAADVVVTIGCGDACPFFPGHRYDEIVQAADVVVTIGCGDACPLFPGHRYVEWALPDPAGQSVDAVRPIRDDIEERVRRLLDELGITPVA